MLIWVLLLDVETVYVCLSTWLNVLWLSFLKLILILLYTRVALHLIELHLKRLLIVLATSWHLLKKLLDILLILWSLVQQIVVWLTLSWIGIWNANEISDLLVLLWSRVSHQVAVFGGIELINLLLSKVVKLGLIIVLIELLTDSFSSCLIDLHLLKLHALVGSC